jgi:hypothetical protein
MPQPSQFDFVREARQLKDGCARLARIAEIERINGLAIQGVEDAETCLDRAILETRREGKTHAREA